MLNDRTPNGVDPLLFFFITVYYEIYSLFVRRQLKGMWLYEDILDSSPILLSLLLHTYKSDSMIFTFTVCLGIT